MLSLSMSFLLWSWARSRGSWAIHRRGRAEKPAKKPDLFSTRPPVGGAPERSQAGFYELHARGVESMSRPARGFWVFLSAKIGRVFVPRNLCQPSAGEHSAAPAHDHGCDCIRRAHSRQPSRDPAPRAEAPPGPEAFRRRPDSPARSRRDSTNAPGPAPLRRGRPPRRPEEVDARDHTSHGAR